MNRAAAVNVAARAVELATGPTIPYTKLDCQAFVEQCVNDCGGRLAAAGSNDMLRNHAAWWGTLQNAQAEGRLVPGAAVLMLREESEKLPAKYRGDGVGDCWHIGLYVGENALYDADKSGKERLCNVVHSSSGMGRVAGSTLKNGWTHVMWFNEIDYGAQAAPGVTPGVGAAGLAQAAADASASDALNDGALDARAINELFGAPAPSYVTVESANGGPVRIREKPKRGAITKYSAPVGTRLLVLGEQNGYYRVDYLGKARWIDKRYTKAG